MKSQRISMRSQSDVSLEYFGCFYDDFDLCVFFVLNFLPFFCWIFKQNCIDYQQPDRYLNRSCCYYVMVVVVLL